MAVDMALAPAVEDRDHKRQLALLKAVGLDRAAPEQRELAVAIAKRYDLDLLLKHLVLVDGRPYVTRDALLWIAHRSGQFDGITVTKPVVEGDYWYAEATVWRKDMSHPIVYGGRYPVKGKNQAFAPEMAVKVAESMALRRAFNVSAPSQDERWDAEASIPSTTPEPQPTLAERAAAKARQVRAAPTPAQIEDGEWEEPDQASEATAHSEAEVAAEPGRSPSMGSAATATCNVPSPYDDVGACVREPGHTGNHRGSDKTSW